MKNAEAQIRTGDSCIFSAVLYQLSYLGRRVDWFALPPSSDSSKVDALVNRALRG